MYESFYGLTGKPFQLSPDPSFYFGSVGHKRAQAYLEYGLHQSEGFIVITGEVGAGKTTLIRDLLCRLDPKRIVAGHLVSTQLDAPDILRLVLGAFGLPSKTLVKAQLLLVLETYLVTVTSKGKRVLLIVDEAQNLSAQAIEELRMLSNFQLGEHALLQSFLVGQPEFRAIMLSPKMEQLRQRVIASYHLGAMSEEETRAYVEHRLHHVNWNNRPYLEEGAYRSIYAYSGGIPRRINTICDRLLLAGYLQKKETITSPDVTDVVNEMREEVGSVVQWGVGSNPTTYDDTIFDGARNSCVSPEGRRDSDQTDGSGFGGEAARLERRMGELERTILVGARGQSVGSEEKYKEPEEMGGMDGLC